MRRFHGRVLKQSANLQITKTLSHDPSQGPSQDLGLGLGS